MRRRTILVGLTMLAVLPAIAQDQGIYEAAVPEDYSFVRVVHMSGTTGALGSLSGVSFITGESGASDYIAVAPGPRVLEADGERWTVQLPAAKILTVAYRAGGDPVLLEDIVADDPTKATLALYNFSDAEASMSTFLKQDVEILPPTAPSTAAYRAINSATIPIKILQGSTMVAELADQAIQRRTIVSYFVFGVDGGVHVTSQVDRTRE
jgi:hypothetical protein